MTGPMARGRGHGLARRKNNPLVRHLRENITRWSLVAALGLAATLRFRLLSVPFERDEGEYAYSAQLMLQGIAPYDLAYTMKLPGVPTVYAAMMLAFGETHQGVHLGLLLVNLATMGLLFAVGKRLIGIFAGVSAAAFYAVLSTLPGVQGLWANSEHFVVPFALAGILVYLRWLGDRRDRFLVLAGALLGCGVVMKQHGAAFFSFVLACVVWELYVMRVGSFRPFVRPLVSLFGGAAIPIGLMAVLVFALGNFDKFLFWTVEYAMSYTTGNDLERGLFNLVRKGGSLFREASAIGFVAALSPFCLDWSPTRRNTSARLCLFFVFSFIAISPGLFFRPHYFILLLPAVSLLAGASFDRAYQLVAEHTENRAARGIPALLAMLTLFVTLLVNQDYLLHSSPNEVLRSTYGINPFSEAVEIGRWLNENTEEDEQIAVIGSEPQIYFYANRKSATGYIYTYPLMEDQPKARQMQREMAAEIEAAAPRYLVYVHDTSSWAITKRSPQLILDWFWKFQNQYRIVGWSEARPEGSVVHWGQPSVWPPDSPSWMAVYHRIGAQRVGAKRQGRQ